MSSAASGSAVANLRRRATVRSAMSWEVVTREAGPARARERGDFGVEFFEAAGGSRARERVGERGVGRDEIGVTVEPSGVAGVCGSRVEDEAEGARVVVSEDGEIGLELDPVGAGNGGVQAVEIDPVQGSLGVGA